MVLSRTQARAAFDHVMDNVLDRGDDSSLKQALTTAGFRDIYQLLELQPADVEHLVYREEDGEDDLPIRRGDKGLLFTFLEFVSARGTRGTPIDDWLALTIEEFDAFRIEPVRIFVRNPETLAAPGVPTVSPAPRAPSLSAAAQFKRGIKRDPSVFPTLKDESLNDAWHRSFVNQARAQDVEEVLNEDFKPATEDEKELFEEKKKYVYAVLESKVQTDRGRALVRDYEETYDAQAAYAALKRHHLQSTRAQMDSSIILSYITTARFGDGTWRSTAESFVIHWQNQVRLYERISGDTFPDKQKRVLLENAVHGVTELRQVKNNADLDTTKTGKALTYDQYCSVLLSACAGYDQHQQSRSRSRRSVMFHEFGGEEANLDSTSGDDSGFLFDIDAPVSELQVYATDRRPSGFRGGQSATSAPRTRMPRERWMQLGDSARQTWDTLSDKDKAIILGLPGPTRDPTPERDSAQTLKSAIRRTVQFADTTQNDSGDDHNPDDGRHDEFHDATQDIDTPNTESTLLVNAARSTTGNSLAPHDVRRLLSRSSNRSVNVLTIYRVSEHHVSHVDSLLDRGANGGVAGCDVRVISKSLPHRRVNIQGIDNHQMTDLELGTVGGVVRTQKGPVIAIFHQYALYGKGPSIHASGQLEHYKNTVDDKSLHVGGKQCITTLDGFVLPLNVQQGLARLPIRPFTDTEWDSLPHVFLTNDLDWDPSVLDYKHDGDDWFGDISDGLDTTPPQPLFDDWGNLRVHTVDVQDAFVFATVVGDPFQELQDAIQQYWEQVARDEQRHYQVHHGDVEVVDEDDAPGRSESDVPSSPRTVTRTAPDYDRLRPCLGWLSLDVVKKTMQHTTQLARLPAGTLLKRAFKSPNPALNVHRRSEAVACDIVYSDTPAVDDGAKSAVLFVGHDTFVTDIYGIKTDSQFIRTLEDNIRERGAPDRLLSDRAQVEISKAVENVLRTFCVKSWQSEPHQQQQNPAERRFQTVKTAVNRILDRTGAPPSTWLLCTQYVCFLLNHTYNETLRTVPIKALTGSTPDISVLLRFHFWQRVLYKQSDYSFPSSSPEGVGHIVGVSEHVGPALCYKILTDDTQKVIFRSSVRPFTDADPNLRAARTDGEILATPPSIVQTRGNPVEVENVSQVDFSTPDATPPVPLVNAEDLIGRSFLTDTDDDGQKLRARISHLVEDYDAALDSSPDRIKFVCKVGEDEAEEVFSYAKIMEFLNRDADAPIWKFKRIVSHQGPLRKSDPNYKGSSYNVLIEWEDGEITTEPLTSIAADDPVTCAIYAKENGLLELPGWKQFRHIAKRHKKYVRLVNQAKLRSYNSAPRFKYGFEIPRDYAHAMRLDERNKNTKWKDAVALELLQIQEYETFKDLGHKSRVRPPAGYKRIRVHLVFDVKHDGRHKARLVADGHLTEIPVESVYSGVVSLRGFRLVAFLAELNALLFWATDIGNAYLEAFTSEFVYIEAGPEFGELLGHILVISKALYGLRTSSSQWADRLADVMRELGFQQCKAEPYIWLRRNGDVYEYVAVYVDDLALAMKDPQSFVDQLVSAYKFKLKGTGPVSFHLGMDLTRDDDGTLCMSQKKYTEKLIANYERMYGESPKQNVTSPLEKGDHPELDTSEFLDEKGTRDYQSLVGSLQWLISIGRFDIMTAVMTMSSFRAAPRKGHLDRVKRIFGYVSKMRNAAIRFRTEEPDLSDVPVMEFDWAKSVYGDVKEILPHDAPEPLGKHVVSVHYVDANLMHCMATGKSVTGILHFLNKTPIDWYSKKQATVETATYGSEFVAARTCVEQIIDIRNTLRYLGVPIRDQAFMFGDNQSVVNSATTVHAKLHKRHTMLSFHRVREAIASGMIAFVHIPGDKNPADILSKHWGYSQIWSLLKPVLFWMGDTSVIED